MRDNSIVYQATSRADPGRRGSDSLPSPFPIVLIPKNSGLKEKALENIKDEKIKGKIIEARGEDIPLIVSEFVKQDKEVIGITGEDLFKEFLLKTRNSNVGIIKRILWEDKSFLFGKPTLCLLGEKNRKIEEMEKKLRICINSKYKELAKKYCTNLLENQGYNIEKIYASGATEEFFSNNIADLVIDIVCSGKSAEEAGLKVYDKLFESDIVILGGKNETINSQG